MNKLNVLALFLSFFGIHTALATTYYVDNCVTVGNDTNAGTSTSAPWLTVNKVNTTTFSPGDTVFFQGACTWREMLKPTSSGSSASVVYFTSYGSGSPTFSGADQVTSFTSTASSSPGYFTLNGSTTYLSTPSTSANNLSGTNIGIAADIAFTTYNSGATQIIAAKDNGNANSTRGWSLAVGSGRVYVSAYNGSGGAVNYFFSTNAGLAISSAPGSCTSGGNTALIAGTQYWFYVAVQPSAGTSQLYCSIDGVNYPTTPLGSLTGLPTIVLNSSNSTPVTIGAQYLNTANTSIANQATGAIYGVEAFSNTTSPAAGSGSTSLNGLTGSATPVFYASANDATAGNSTWTSSATGEVWTMAPNSSLLTSETAITIFCSSVTSAPPQVFRDNVRLVQVASQGELGTGTWYSNAGSSSICVYDAPSGHSIEQSTRPNALAISGLHYVTFNNLTFTKTAQTGIVAANSTSYIQLSTIVSTYNFKSGAIAYAPASSQPNDHWVVQSGTFAYNNEAGFEENGYGNYWTVAYNSFHDNSLTATILYTGGFRAVSTSSSSNPSGRQGSNLLVQYNEAYNNGVPLMGQNLSTGDGIWFDTVGAGCIMRYNRAWNNNDAGFLIEITDGAEAYGNVSYGNGTGLRLYNQDTNNQIYNNTLANNTLTNLSASSVSSGGGFSNNTFTNNVATGVGRSLTTQYGGSNDGTNGSGNVYTYNNFGVATAGFLTWGSTPTQYSSYVNWETAAGNCGTSGCSHSVQASPGFNNSGSPAFDFSLSSTSANINAGLALSSSFEYDLDPSSVWPHSVTTDNQNTYSLWEVGAYVYPH